MTLIRDISPNERMASTEANYFGVGTSALEWINLSLQAARIHTSDIKHIQFDLIWVGSLLTHLDNDHWSAFLKVFSTALRDRGLLIFTTHGRHTYNLFSIAARLIIMKPVPT